MTQRRSGVADGWEFDYSVPNTDSTSSVSEEVTPSAGKPISSSSTGAAGISALDADVLSILGNGNSHANTSRPVRTKSRRGRNHDICPKCGEELNGEPMREHVSRCRPPYHIDVGTWVRWQGRPYVVVAIDDMPDTYMIVDQSLDFKRDVPAKDLRIPREKVTLPDEPPF